MGKDGKLDPRGCVAWGKAGDGRRKDWAPWSRQGRMSPPPHIAAVRGSACVVGCGLVCFGLRRGLVSLVY